MKIYKEKIVDNPGVYSTGVFDFGGKTYFGAVSENRGERAFIIDASTLKYEELWKGDTGVMNIIQIPHEEKLLAITKFYPIFQSKEACIISLVPDGGVMKPWKTEKAFDLPYCHRIGLITIRDEFYLVCCTLCKDKDFLEDWTKPGAIYIAKVPKEQNETWKVAKVFEGLTKNHGLFINHDNQVYIGSENGIMLFDFSSYQDGDMVFPKVITTTPTSDIWISGDFMATIEPFHGDVLSLYEFKERSIQKKESYTIDFGHVVWIGKFLDQDVIIAGSRGGTKALELINLSTGERIEIDSGVGTTQISVLENGESLTVIAANHGVGEICLYTIK